jgi:NADPH:quinone reductase-like Zn-dependent oxidoreductase
MHGYKEPLRLEEIPVPEFGPDETLVKVAAAGMCRADLEDYGYFPLPSQFQSRVAGAVNAISWSPSGLGNSM